MEASFDVLLPWKVLLWGKTWNGRHPIYAPDKKSQNNNKTDYLETAERCAEVIWKRGILHCGYGLSDGTAGNAYAFLAMYKLTKKNLYLHRAIKFAEWCCDFGKHDCPNPEFPCSLFEGLAGAVYFLSDILNPETACFPAFELTWADTITQLPWNIPYSMRQSRSHTRVKTIISQSTCTDLANQKPQC